MQTLLALLPEQQDIGKSIALPPDKPSTSLLALLLASPADDSFDPADVPPLEALDEKESDINDSLSTAIVLEMPMKTFQLPRSSIIVIRFPITI
jgi:hypothetical protein